MIVEGDNSVPWVSVDVNDLDILFLDSLRKHFIRQVGLDDSLPRLRKCSEIYVIVRYGISQKEAGLVANEMTNQEKKANQKQ